MNAAIQNLDSFCGSVLNSPSAKAAWEMTREEWMSEPRSWEGPARLVTLNEWRANHGYSNPLDDHGDFRHPHGITPTIQRGIDRRFAGRTASMLKGAAEYNTLLKEGKIPKVRVVYEYLADGMDSDAVVAGARLRHRLMVRKAVHEGLPVSDAVKRSVGMIG